MIEKILMWKRVLLVALLLSVGIAQEHCLSRLSSQISAILNMPTRDESVYGIYAQHFINGSFLDMFTHNHRTLFQPASTNKLLTCAATLIELSPDHRFETVFDSNNKVLRVCAKGDPSMSYEMLQKVSKEIISQHESFDKLVLDLSYYGIDHLTETHFPMSWQWDDLQTDYGTQPSYGTILNENIVTVLVHASNAGKPCYIDILPTGFTKDLIRYNGCITGNSSLAKEEQFVNVYYDIGERLIKVIGQLRNDNNQTYNFPIAVMRPHIHYLEVLKNLFNISDAVIKYTTGTEECSTNVTSIVSDPISLLMNYTLMTSNNLYTETFMRHLASRTKKTPTMRSLTIEDIGITRVKDLLSDKLNVPRNSYVMHDGSGLSRMNLMSPLALVSTLNGIYLHAYGSIFRSMLPVAGISGSLKNRFVKYPGILEAKTGGMTGVSSLAGYINNDHYEKPIIFAIIANQWPFKSSEVRDLIDQIALLLAFADPKC